MKIYLATQPKPDIEQQQRLLDKNVSCLLVAYVYFINLSGRERVIF